MRCIGITTSHGREHAKLERVLQTEPFDVVQFRCNIENRTAEERLLPLAADRGIATLINRPFQRGALFRRVKGLPPPEWASDFDAAAGGRIS